MPRLLLAVLLALPPQEAAAAAARTALPAALAAPGAGGAAGWRAFLSTKNPEFGSSLGLDFAEDGAPAALAGALAASEAPPPADMPEAMQAEAIRSALAVEAYRLRGLYDASPESFGAGGEALRRLVLLEGVRAALPPAAHDALESTFKRWAAAHGDETAARALAAAAALARSTLAPESAPAAAGSEPRALLAPASARAPAAAAEPAPAAPGGAASVPALARLRLFARVHPSLSWLVAKSDPELLSAAVERVRGGAKLTTRAGLELRRLIVDARLPAPALERFAEWMGAVAPEAPWRKSFVKTVLSHRDISERGLISVLSRLEPADAAEVARAAPPAVVARVLLAPEGLRAIEGFAHLVREKRLRIPAEDLGRELAARWAASGPKARARVLRAWNYHQETPAALLELFADSLLGAREEADAAADLLLRRADPQGVRPDVLDEELVRPRIRRARRSADSVIAARALELGARYGVPAGPEDYDFLVEQAISGEDAIERSARAVLGSRETLGSPWLERLEAAIPSAPLPRAAALVRVLAATKRLSSAQEQALFRLMLDARPDVAAAAVEGLKHRRAGPWPEATVRRLTELLSGPHARLAVDVLAARSPYPPELSRLLLRTLARGGEEAAAKAAYRLSSSRHPTLEQKHALLDGWRKAPAERKPYYASVMKDWFPAGELARELWPEHARRLLAVVPGLDRLSAKGFMSPDFATREARERLLRALETVDRSLGGVRDALKRVASLEDLRAVAVFDPGGAEFRAGDWTLLYPAPGADVERAFRPPLIARYSLGSDEGRRRADEVLSEFDRLIQGNFAALSLLSEFVEEPTRRRAEAVAAMVDRMVEAYKKLAPDDGEAQERAWKATRAAAEKSWSRLRPGQTLSAKAVNEITAMGSWRGRASVHLTINRLHKAALAAVMERAKSLGADGQLELGGERIQLLDAGARPALEGGRARAPFLRLLPPGNMGNGTLILRDDEAWYHVRLGVHKAELHVKLAGPDEGGLLSLRYSDSYDNDGGSKMRKAHVAAIMRMLGAEIVEDKGKFLSAALDKDHGLSSREQIERAVPVLLAALNRTRDLDLMLNRLRPSHYAYLENLRESLLADGQVDFFQEGFTESMKIAAAKRAARRSPQAAALRAALDARLAGLGLAPLPADRLMGQRLIDEHYNLPLRRARAAGEIVAAGDGSLSSASVDPLAELRRAAREDEEQSVARGAWLEGAPEELSRFEALGFVGLLKAERAFWADPAGEDVVVDVLREPGSGAIAYALARVWRRGASRVMTAAELGERLRDAGAPEPVPVGAARRSRWRERLAAQPEPGSGRPSAAGLAASPGRAAFASGRAAFRGEGDERSGAVLIAPYTTPDDLERMRRAAAVVTTGGGLLSHAAITTRELGVPAVILPRASWSGDGTRVRTEAGDIRPGTLLRVDGRAGRVERLGADEEESRAYAAALDYLRDAGASPARAARALLGGRGLAPERAAEFVIEEAFWGAQPEQARERALALLRAWDWAAAARTAASIAERRLRALRLALEGAASDASSASPREERARLGALAREFGLRLEALEALGESAPPAPAPRRGAAPAARGLVEGARRERSERLRAAEPLTLPFGEIDDSMSWIVGGKAAKLGEIAQVVSRAGGRLPDGFGVTTYAYRVFLREAGLEKKHDALAARIDAFLDKADLDSPATIKRMESYADEMRSLIRSAPIARDGAVGAAVHAQLEAQGMSLERLAVRSSAVQEDRDEAAFAGAAESYLYVPREELLGRVADAWASFWLPRGILYRRRQGLLSTQLEPAVAVQRMADADSAGVLFTINPVTGRREIVVNAAYGLGEGVVSGLVQADQYVLDRRGEELEAAALGDKSVQVLPAAGGGTEISPVPLGARRRRVLKPSVLKKLARIGAALEEHFGFPVDVEFAMIGGKVYVLQSRPVTTKN